MTNDKQQITSKISRFQLALLGIFLFSLILRFWNLGQFNKLVFDEIYYAKFANNYLIGKPFFNAHPPLSQYIIAIGIWLGSHFPAAPDIVNNLTGSSRSTISYRWLNALTGSFIPLVVAAIAYQLTRRQTYALIAAIFAAADGLFLVESRYALNNIYLVILGLLGQLFFLLYVNDKRAKQWLLILSGIFLGSAAAIKWNGLSFLLGIYLLLAIARAVYFLQKGQRKDLENDLAINRSSEVSEVNAIAREDIWKNLAAIKLIYIIIHLLILPIFTYSLLWLPHLQMNPQYGFWQMQQEILSYHQRIGSGTNIHPYCSSWYTWPLMWRPVAYLYQKSKEVNPRIYDVHAMGNPVLWWLSTLAILTVIFFLVSLLIANYRKSNTFIVKSTDTWLATYITVNYIANILPWIGVKRCTFLYHYMGAYVFAWLALAWIVYRCLQHKSSAYRLAGWAAIFVVCCAFIYWLPIYLGFPLSQPQFKLRFLFPNWI